MQSCLPGHFEANGSALQGWSPEHLSIAASLPRLVRVCTELWQTCRYEQARWTRRVEHRSCHQVTSQIAQECGHTLKLMLYLRRLKLQRCVCVSESLLVIEQL